MGGGKAILTLTSTPAIVGTGTTTTDAKSTVPKNNFFIMLPPSPHHGTGSHFPGSHPEGTDIDDLISRHRDDVLVRERQDFRAISMIAIMICLSSQTASERVLLCPCRNMQGRFD
jgi:hypothetical protein